MNEEQMIELICKKEVQGLEELQKQYGPLIKYVIAPFFTNAQDGEDCFAEVIIKIWDNIDTYDENKGGLKTWITTIARNCAINMKKKEKYTTVELAENITESTSSNQMSPEEAILRKERTNMVWQAVQTLRKTDALLIYRKYYYCQSTEQIASEMNMTVRAVEGKLYRIRKKLEKKLGGVING